MVFSLSDAFSIRLASMKSLYLSVKIWEDIKKSDEAVWLGCVAMFCDGMLEPVGLTVGEEWLWEFPEEGFE